MIVATIPLKTVSETNAREHWASRHRRRAKQRTTTGLVVRGALVGVRLDGRIAVHLVRLAPSAGLDGDNLVSSLKAVRDGVADALGLDDADPRVTWSYGQQRAKRGHWAVEVRIMRGEGEVAA